MSYNYEAEKFALFTESGQRNLLKVRDKVRKLLHTAGCVRMDAVMTVADCASSWEGLAYVDRLVELGELREIKYGPCAGQHRIFVGAGEWWEK